MARQVDAWHLAVHKVPPTGEDGASPSYPVPRHPSFSKAALAFTQQGHHQRRLRTGIPEALHGSAETTPDSFALTLSCDFKPGARRYSPQPSKLEWAAHGAATAGRQTLHSPHRVTRDETKWGFVVATKVLPLRHGHPLHPIAQIRSLPEARCQPGESRRPWTT